MAANRGTKTSSFGVSGRLNHDSSKFYRSNLYSEIEVPKNPDFIENKIPESKIDKIYCKSSEKMDEIPDNSVHLMVTSPPYNVGKEYDDNLTLTEYFDLLKNVFQETYNKLVTGGRACINIANVGRKPYIPLHAYVTSIMLDIGFLMRGEIIWDKSASAGTSCAWGSWRSASNPVLRDVHEYILVFSKDSFSRKKDKSKISTIKKEEFLEWTKSVWRFPAASAKKIGHPAPFPVELPYRLIQLYTFKGDLILDPFCGSGSTCIAAIKAGRHYIGYDIKEEYVELSQKRIMNYKSQSTLLD